MKNLEFRTDEIWKDIKGYEGIYQVSNLGRVRSLDRVNARGWKIKGILLKPRLKRDGYVDVHLSFKDKDQSPKIHRLVAEAFMPIPEELKKWSGTQYLQVNHKDENKTNNMVWLNEDGSIDYDKSNLEWCTAQYNSMWGTKRERQKEKIKKSVMQYDMDGTFIKKWDSIKDATYSIVGHNSGRIIDCLKGRSTSAYGYKWKYEV